MAIEGDECKQCIILHQWLEAEQEKREYYEKLLLTRVGILTTAPDITDLESYPSVRKVTTMSTIRKMAREASMSRAEAAKKFEEALVKAK